MTFDTYITKNSLNAAVDKKMNELGITISDYPVNSRDIACRLGIEIIEHKFKSIMICGILYKGTHKSTIILNSLRSLKGQNFDCMHELIHYWYHENGDYLCLERNNRLNMEWQANEGAAQALMPQKLFITRFLQYGGSPGILSELFKVGESAVVFRALNLRNKILSASNPWLDYSGKTSREIYQHAYIKYFDVIRKANAF